MFRFVVLLRNYVRLMNVQIYRWKLRYSDIFFNKPDQVYKPEECQDLERTPWTFKSY